MKSGIFDTTSLVYLENKSIDRYKWDRCIETAPNELIYPYSFYLDTMAKHWDALVMNDYEAVMPLTWNKKYGVYYLYQPFLCASLGLFGKNITAEMLSCFLDKIPKRFKYWDIYLNTANNFTIEKYSLYKRINYLLDIKNDYPSLFKNFRNSYRQLIRKKETNQLVIKQNINLDEITDLAQNKLQQISKVKTGDLRNFEQLYRKLYSTAQATNYGVYKKGELLASGVFLFSRNRAYYVLAGNKSKGRLFGASQLVIDTFIKQYADKNMLLDFEGSNVPGIAFFFKGFGAAIEEYPGLKYNALPAILRRFKK